MTNTEFNKRINDLKDSDTNNGINNELKTFFENAANRKLMRASSEKSAVSREHAAAVAKEMQLLEDTKKNALKDAVASIMNTLTATIDIDGDGKTETVQCADILARDRAWASSKNVAELKQAAALVSLHYMIMTGKPLLYGREAQEYAKQFCSDTPATKGNGEAPAVTPTIDKTAEAKKLEEAKRVKEKAEADAKAAVAAANAKALQEAQDKVKNAKTQAEKDAAAKALRDAQEKIEAEGKAIKEEDKPTVKETTHDINTLQIHYDTLPGVDKLPEDQKKRVKDIKMGDKSVDEMILSTDGKKTIIGRKVPLFVIGDDKTHYPSGYIILSPDRKTIIGTVEKGEDKLGGKSITIDRQSSPSRAPILKININKDNLVSGVENANDLNAKDKSTKELYKKYEFRGSREIDGKTIFDQRTDKSNPTIEGPDMYGLYTFYLDKNTDKSGASQQYIKIEPIFDQKEPNKAMSFKIMNNNTLYNPIASSFDKNGEVKPTELSDKTFFFIHDSMPFTIVEQIENGVQGFTINPTEEYPEGLYNKETINGTSSSIILDINPSYEFNSDKKPVIDSRRKESNSFVYYGSGKSVLTLEKVYDAKGNINQNSIDEANKKKITDFNLYDANLINWYGKDNLSNSDKKSIFEEKFMTKKDETIISPTDFTGLILKSHDNNERYYNINHKAEPLDIANETKTENLKLERNKANEEIEKRMQMIKNWSKAVETIESLKDIMGGKQGVKGFEKAKLSDPTISKDDLQKWMDEYGFVQKKGSTMPMEEIIKNGKLSEIIIKRDIVLTEQEKNTTTGKMENKKATLTFSLNDAGDIVDVDGSEKEDGSISIANGQIKQKYRAFRENNNVSLQAREKIDFVRDRKDDVTVGEKLKSEEDTIKAGHNLLTRIIKNISKEGETDYNALSQGLSEGDKRTLEAYVKVLRRTNEKDPMNKTLEENYGTLYGAYVPTISGKGLDDNPRRKLRTRERQTWYADRKGDMQHFLDKSYNAVENHPFSNKVKDDIMTIIDAEKITDEESEIKPSLLSPGLIEAIGGADALKDLKNVKSINYDFSLKNGYMNKADMAIVRRIVEESKDLTTLNIDGYTGEALDLSKHKLTEVSLNTVSNATDWKFGPDIKKISLENAKVLPKDIGNLNKLEELDASNLEKAAQFPLSLKVLNIAGMKGKELIKTNINNLINLTKLTIHNQIDPNSILRDSDVEVTQMVNAIDPKDVDGDAKDVDGDPKDVDLIQYSTMRKNKAQVNEALKNTDDSIKDIDGIFTLLNKNIYLALGESSKVSKNTRLNIKVRGTEGSQETYNFVILSKEGYKNFDQKTLKENEVLLSEDDKDILLKGTVQGVEGTDRTILITSKLTTDEIKNKIKERHTSEKKQQPEIKNEDIDIDKFLPPTK